MSGTDIAQFTRFRTREDALAYERELDAVVDRLERVTKPTIAQVQGVATGGGCAIALACDLRVCTPDARFGVPVARTLGNCLSAANYARLLDLLGPAAHKELMFTGRLIDGRRGPGPRTRQPRRRRQRPRSTPPSASWQPPSRRTRRSRSGPPRRWSAASRSRAEFRRSTQTT